jgi:hypothetical protein
MERYILQEQLSLFGELRNRENYRFPQRRFRTAALGSRELVERYQPFQKLEGKTTNNINIYL